LLTEKGEIVTLVNAEDEQDNFISDEEEDENEKDPENMGDDNEEEDSDEEMDAFERDFYGDFDDEEESLSLETEVEQMEHSLGDQKLTFKIFLAEDEDHEYEFTRWMQTIRVHCSYEGKEIGRGFGRYVQRERIRDSFWRDMEEPCQELSSIAFELFDRYGRLRTELKDHPIQKGTGVWGSELDLGSFFVIEDLLIDKEWRRKAIGTKIVTYLIEKSRARSRHPQFSLVVPGWLTRDIESDIRGKTKDQKREIRVRAVDNATWFYRSLGFRRIGASNCFGLATDANHPARAILPTDDFDPAVEEPDVDEGPEHESSADWGVDDNRKSWRLELLKDRLPLHHATITLPDSECVEFFRAWKSDKNPADEWTKVERYSNNVLHIAACELKVQTVRWLIDDSGEGQILSVARNVKGYTPIEELESDLETKRTRRNYGMMTVDISDNFSGFAPEAISCLAALRSLGNLSQIQYAQLKFGCTCGLCIDGFLSPRMSFALLCQAEITHDALNEDVENGETWCMMHDDLITHVAPDIQRNFATNKSYRQGFANIFHHAATTLRNNRSPTILNVLNKCMDASEWPPHTKNFLRRGGEPESVLRIMFENTKDQDEWAGDGMHMEVFEEQVKALPECRNDHEFGFAALACGTPKLTRLYG
jgi:GNAT superfamily N-acetyltransferase